MGTAQLVFAGVYRNGSDVSHVPGSGPVRKFVLRMRNRKLRNIRLSEAFSPEVTIFM